MIRRFAAVVIVGGLLLASAAPGNARSRPRRMAQNCSGKTCKAPAKRLVPCAGDASRLCVVMRGDKIGSSVTATNTISWQSIPGAAYYRITIAGYRSEWRSGDLEGTNFNYDQLNLQAGSAYLATITTYGSNGEVIQSIEKAINIPATRASSQSK
jgi:hypothetical protein